MDSAFRVVFLFLAIASAFGTYWLGGSGRTGAAATMATLTVIFGAFAFLTRFKRFKGLGFEGELWEQEMEQAAQLRRNLEGLAEHLGETVVWQTAPRRRSQYGHFQQKLATIERTTRILSDIGVTPQRIEEIKRPWHKSIKFDLARPIVRSLTSKNVANSKQVHDAIAAERERRLAGSVDNGKKSRKELELETQLDIMEQAKRRQDDLIWRDDYDDVPRLLAEFIDQSRWLTPEDRQAVYRDRAEEFLDINQYGRHQTIRRPEVLNRSRLWA
jgi:hypothetical protein